MTIDVTLTQALMFLGFLGTLAGHWFTVKSELGKAQGRDDLINQRQDFLEKQQGLDRERHDSLYNELRADIKRILELLERKADKNHGAKT